MLDSNSLLFIGPKESILILVAVILLFVAKKIPELMKGIGQGMKEFKDAQKPDAPTDKPEKK